MSTDRFPDSLVAHLTDWHQRYKDLNPDDQVKYGATSQLMIDFEQFSRNYWGLLNKLATEATLHDSSLLEYYRYQITSHLVHEWEGIGRVLEQRENERYAEWLKSLDGMAQEMLPASLRVKGSGSVVACMGPSTELRYLPYSKVSIVSVPYALYDNKDESRLSLAHEVGHHVWRLIQYNELQGTRSKRRLTALARETAKNAAATHLHRGKLLDPEAALGVGDLVSSWMSELFADVYGAYALSQTGGHPPTQETQIGTLDFVKSYVSLMLGQIRNNKDLLDSDGAHPFPFFRPLIRAYVMDWLKNGSNADDMPIPGDPRWQPFIDHLGLKVNDKKVPFRIPSEPVPAPTDETPPEDCVHKWKRFSVPLVTVWKAVEAVIDEVAKPIIIDLSKNQPFEFYSGVFTFDWWLGSVWGFKETRFGEAKALDYLLSAEISLRVGLVSTGVESGAAFCGSHDDSGTTAWHTHSC